MTVPEWHLDKDPEGVQQDSPGREPWVKSHNCRKPCKGDAIMLFKTGTNCFAFSGLPLLLYVFPGLTPWAVLRRPFGAPGSSISRMRQEIVIGLN